MPSRWVRLVATLGIWCAGLSAFAAGPRDELLRLVPDDCAFCFVAQDLRTHGDQLTRSPFVKQFLGSRFGLALAQSPDLKKLAELDQQLVAGLGVTVQELRDDIFGDCFAFTYRPGPPGREELEEGLFLVRARDPQKLASLVAKLNRSQLDAKELASVEERKHGNRTYFARIKRGEPTEFASVQGPILLFSTSEPQLKAALDRSTASATDAPSPMALRLQKLGVADRPIVWFIQPRAFDAHLKAKLASVAGEEAAFLENFQRYWQAVDGAALYVDLDRQLSLGLAISAQTEQLPASARKFLHESAAASALWGAFPDDALAAMAVRLSWGHFFEAFGEFLTPDARKQISTGVDRSIGATLGPDAWAQTFERVGPELGVCIAPPLAELNTWVPLGTAAVRFRPDPQQPGQEKRLMTAMHFLSMVLVLSYNQQHPEPLRLKTTQQGEIEVRYLTKDKGFPPGWQPAYAYKEGYVVLGSHPLAIRNFQPAAPKALPADGEVPLCKFSFAATGKYLRDQREPLVGLLAENANISRAEAQLQLESALDAIDLFDRLELTHRPGPTTTIQLKLTPKQPFAAGK